MEYWVDRKEVVGEEEVIVEKLKKEKNDAEQRSMKDAWATMI